ncbi:MAG: phage portal protein [Clostridia bacterium]|nr:phage portal protein [Clostridia bacterium]
MELLSGEAAWRQLQAHNRAYYQMFSAVYSGNPASLRTTARPKSFWRRPSKQKIHVPIAADIAATSSDLLFGEEPQIQAVDERENPVEAVQRRLEAISRHTCLHALLCEAAESCSALGDVYLKVMWDVTDTGYPLIRVVQGDSAWPEYRMGRLRAIHIFTEIDAGMDTGVLRTHEVYMPGAIQTELYLGSDETLGLRLEDERLLDLGFQPVCPVPENLMLAAHIPNIRPNRMFRGSYMGRSDFDNLRDLMDALDETYSSWIRDIRLGKARLLVPAEYLRRTGEDLFGTGRSIPTFEFDEDVETLVALDVDTDRGGNTITPSQFSIRADDHAKTCQDIIMKIVSGAGYAPQTFGINIEGMAQSGTALRIREKKSYSTTGKKQAYWQDSLETLLTSLIRLDATLYPSGGCTGDAHIHVRFPTIYTSDLPTMASSLSMLTSAQAMSTEVKVQMLHPDWTQDQVTGEVGRILSEYGQTGQDSQTGT